MRHESLKTAVLFIVFNRPDTTFQVFNQIRTAKPERLYIAADGPRLNNKNDILLCEKVKSITENIDWPCEVKRLYSKENLGCTQAVAGAISWFFRFEEEGIILEDDVLPKQSFFLYCQELLEKYRNENDIFVISGCNLTSAKCNYAYSYFFSNYNHIWGWATWKRAWIHYDPNMRGWRDFIAEGGMKKVRDGDFLFALYWNSILSTYAKKIKSSWGYVWAFTVWKNNGIAIRPSVNLITNIGFGNNATHTKSHTPQYVIDSPATEIEFPLNHPPEKKIYKLADTITDKIVFNISIINVILSKIFSYNISIKIKNLIENHTLNGINNKNSMSDSVQPGRCVYDNSVAKSYESDREIEPIWPIEQEYMKNVVKKFPLRSTLLDAPVGSGRFFQYYKARELNVVGVDISKAMLEQASLKAVNYEKISLYCRDVRKLDIQDGAFDYVVSWRLIHLLPDNQLCQVISELARVSSKKIYLQVFVRDGWHYPLRILKLIKNLLKLIIGDRWQKPTPWSHIQSFSHKQSRLLQVFHQNGLTLKSSDVLGTYGALRVKVYVLEKT